MRDASRPRALLFLRWDADGRWLDCVCAQSARYRKAMSSCLTLDVLLPQVRVLRGVVVGCLPDFGAISARGCYYVTYVSCLKRPPIESASSRSTAVTSLSCLRRIPIESASNWSVILTLMDNTQIGKFLWCRHSYYESQTYCWLSPYSYGATPGNFAVVLCDRPSHSVVTESSCTINGSAQSRRREHSPSLVLSLYCHLVSVPFSQRSSCCSHML